MLQPGGHRIEVDRGLRRNPWRPPPRDHGKSPAQVVHTIEDFRKSGPEPPALSFLDVRQFRDEPPDLLLKQMRLLAGEITPAFSHLRSVAKVALVQARERVARPKPLTPV